MRKSRKSLIQDSDDDGQDESSEEMLAGPKEPRLQEFTVPLLAIDPIKADGRSRGASMGSDSTDSDSIMRPTPLLVSWLSQVPRLAVERASWTGIKSEESSRW